MTTDSKSPHWREVLRRTRAYGDFYVRRPYQDSVFAALEALAHERRGHYHGFPGGGTGGTEVVVDVLDGWARRWTNRWEGPAGVWIYGHDVARFVLHVAGATQPARLCGKAEVPSLEELRTAAERAKSGKSYERPVDDTPARGRVVFLGLVPPDHPIYTGGTFTFPGSTREELRAQLRARDRG